MNSKRNIVVVLFLLVAMLFASCKSKQPVSLTPTITEHTTTEIEEIKRDTVFNVPQDKSYYEAYLACVNGKVVVKDANIKRSKDKALQPPSVNIDKDNKITVDCTVLAQELFVEWVEKYKREVKTQRIEIPIPVPFQPNGWQSTQIWFGRVFMGLLVILAIATGSSIFTKKSI